MNRRLYGVLAVAGAIAPVAMTIVFVSQEGLDLGEFFGQPVETTIGTLVLLDLAIASLAFWAWMIPEARRLELPWPAFIAANLFVGLCFALPLFLYVRADRLRDHDAGRAAPTAA